MRITPLIMIPLLASSLAVAEDWVAAEQLPPAIAQRISPACYGGFLETYTATESDGITFSGDQSRYQLGQGQYQLTGDALITQGNQQVQADQIEFNTNRGIGQLAGDFTLREPGLWVAGETASIDDQGAYRASDGRFVIYQSQLHGTAASYLQTPDGKIYLRQVRLSRCQPGNELWQVGASRLTVNRQANRAQAFNAWINVAGVPVFWSPFFSFPLTDERASGLLTPTIKFSDGLLPSSYQQPLYLNLAPNYDATATYYWYRDIGQRGQLEARYLTQSQRGQWVVDGFSSPDGNQRWHWQFDHQGQLNEQLELTIAASDASDPQWPTDFANEDDPKRYYDQYARLGWQSGPAQLSILYDRDEPAGEDVADNRYRRWPQLNGQYRTRLWQTKLVGDSELTFFRRADSQATRLANRFSASRQWHQQSLPGSLTLSGDMIRHWPNQTASWVPTLTAQQGVRLATNPDNRWQLSAYPSVRYQHTPLVASQAEHPVLDLGNRDDPYAASGRFSGKDAIGDRQQLVFGLGQSLRYQGKQVATWSVRQGLQLAQERLVLQNDELSIAPLNDTWQPTLGPLSLTSQLTPSAPWQFDARLNYDYQDGYQYDSTKLAAQYQRGARFVNLDYQHQATTQAFAEQSLVLASQFRLTPTLGGILASKWHNDDGQTANLAATKLIIGGEWDSCCTHVRAVYQTDIGEADTSPEASLDDGFFIELRLKGVAAHTDGIDQLLQQFNGYRGRLFRFQ